MLPDFRNFFLYSSNGKKTAFRTSHCRRLRQSIIFRTSRM
nr:MAG TPA: hypothetical protein [Caudoviricetes sp.]